MTCVCCRNADRETSQVRGVELCDDCAAFTKGEAVAPLTRCELCGGPPGFHTCNLGVAAPAQGEPLPVQFIPKRACEGAQTLCVFTDRERQCPHQQCAEVVTFRHVPTVAETTEAFKAMCPLNKPASSPVSAELLRALKALLPFAELALGEVDFPEVAPGRFTECNDAIVLAQNLLREDQALASQAKP